VSLIVAVTTPAGQFSGVAAPMGVEALLDLLEELQLRGQGYLEISRRDSDYPMLAVGLSGKHAVIHLFEAQDAVSLLQGDGTVVSEVVEVPIMGELAPFDGVFAVSVEDVRPVVEQFARGGLLSNFLGAVWCRL